MDKNAIKKFAIWARQELIERVSQRAALFGITESACGDPDAESVGGRLLSPQEKRQRRALIGEIREKGYAQVVEKVAYAWFNRFVALRFMEVNGYLPSHVRVFTNDEGAFKPQILAEATQLELEGLDKNVVYELENANKREELYKYLLIVQCNALNAVLPGLFQRIDDYTELLFPDNLLRDGSVVEQMVSKIPEEDWRDQVQIIGWLYQYYNTELKDKVFADLRKNIKITKEKIPAATQLFTPDWIVRYMVENSLGRLWLEGRPNEALQSKWKYYLEEAEQEPEVQARLDVIRQEYATLTPEDIRVIDPCMGSGHILCVLFDVLVQIYEDYGYTARDAAVKIVQKNLWGLDIDDRAAQLAYFSVMMKARQYDRRFLTRNIQPRVYAIQESNEIKESYSLAKGGFYLSKEHQETLDYLIDVFEDAKEYGSILQLEDRDYLGLKAEFESKCQIEGSANSLTLWASTILPRAQQLINQATALSQKFHIVVTNPPYMGKHGMPTKLSAFVEKHYTDAKSDMSAVCMERCQIFCLDHGYVAMINIPVWMFLSSFERMRRGLLDLTTIVNMIHPGRGIFGSDFGSVTFVIKQTVIKGYKGVYCRLFKNTSEVESIEQKEQRFLNGEGRFQACQSNFNDIPGSPIAYWAGPGIIRCFKEKNVGDYADVRSGMSTTDNEHFLRLWFEADFNNIRFKCTSLEEAKNSNEKWYPYNKGGEFRKWYGNNLYIVNWLNDGAEIKYWVTHNPKDPKTTSWGRRIFATDCFFKAGITWSNVTSGDFSCRLYETGFIFDSTACGLFPFEDYDRYYLSGLLNSKVANAILNIISPTIHYNPGSLENLPVLIGLHSTVNKLVRENQEVSKVDWDSFETSWDFQEHPFITFKGVSPYPIKRAFETWREVAEKRFQKLKENEEELNRIFIEIYGLGDDLTPEVADENVTVRKADLQRDVRSFVSYAVGCMFGRYTLGNLGLIYAGGEWNPDKYPLFPADPDNIIPICDDEYFEDDIVGRFVKFVATVFGEETLEENLQFVADALGGKGTPREAIRKYFTNDFYADHLKVYQKRPIYWLFDSGKKNGFKCLIYMHRHRPDTIARIRTDYIHEQQSRYRSAIENLEARANAEETPTSERVKLSKRLEALRAQAEELRVYEEKIHHLADQMISIDLDDGVKRNYEIFKDVLAKIK